MAIAVILIRVNLIVYPISCINCPSYCIRFNTSSKILLVIAEGFNPSLNKSLSMILELIYLSFYHRLIIHQHLRVVHIQTGWSLFNKLCSIEMWVKNLASKFQSFGIPILFIKRLYSKYTGFSSRYLDFRTDM